MNIISTVAAMIIGATAGAVVPVSAATAPTEAVSPYAFAVQPVGCTPGYIKTNPGAGLARYLVEGVASEPGSKLTYRRGIQAEVVAVPASYSYIRSESDGSFERPFYLQVSPLPARCG